MNKKLSRRDFLRLSTAAGIGATLGSLGIPAWAQSNSVDLRFAWWGGELRADVTTQVINMFVERHPEVNFTFEPLSFDEYWAQMATQAAEEGLPDIMQHGTPTLVEWARNGFLLPLDDYIASGAIDITYIPVALQRHGMVDGNIYGLSAGTNANGFVIDLDAFEEAGIAVPEDTWTWEDFEAITLELHEKLGIWGFGTYLHHIDIWRVLYGGYETELYAEDGQSLGYEDDEPLINHMNMILRLQEAGAIPLLAEEIDTQALGPESQFIVSGQAAMDWLAGSNQLVALWGAAGADRRFRIMPIPRPVGGVQGLAIRPSQLVAISVNSGNPEYAAMFLDFFVNDIEANAVLNAERGVPINQLVLAGLEAIADRPQATVYDYMARLGLDSASYSSVLDPLGVEEVRTNVYYPQFAEAVRSGTISAEEGVVLLREMTDEILAAANAE